MLNDCYSQLSFKIISEWNGAFWERFSFRIRIHQTEVQVTDVASPNELPAFGECADSTSAMSVAVKVLS